MVNSNVIMMCNLYIKYSSTEEPLSPLLPLSPPHTALYHISLTPLSLSLYTPLSLSLSLSQCQPPRSLAHYLQRKMGLTHNSLTPGGSYLPRDYSHYLRKTLSQTT